MFSKNVKPELEYQGFCFFLILWTIQSRIKDKLEKKIVYSFLFISILQKLITLSYINIKVFRLTELKLNQHLKNCNSFLTENMKLPNFGENLQWYSTSNKRVTRQICTNHVKFSFFETQNFKAMGQWKWGITN